MAILTRTVLQSPVIHYILHVRLRHQTLNDLVFVGDRFIHVKQVKEGGHLHHVATKTDFDANIRAAKVFNVSDNEPIPEDDIVIKEEDSSCTGAPPQLLVLTLDTNDLIFIYLKIVNGEARFVHQGVPLPTFPRTLWQPGQHLAVDPFSRALAVAADENEVVIYSAKANDQIKSQLKTADANWCPVSAWRPLKVQGVIQHADFLLPPPDDSNHVILLLIVVDGGKTKAIRIEWQHKEDIHHAHAFAPQTLSAAKNHKGLLIPLRNANFLLVNGNDGVIYKNVLSGAATAQTVLRLQDEPPPLYPGCSSRYPMWASWCRPRRNASAQAQADYFYLAREDGKAFLIIATNTPGTRQIRLDCADAGELHCHIGTAFASLGDSQDPDILAAAGDMSSGRVVSIGRFPTTRPLGGMTRAESMAPNLIELIPNWASVTDMVVSSLPQASSKSVRSRDGVFVTSGKQPFGAVTELRRGIEARLTAYFDDEGFRQANDLYILAEHGGTLLVLLSGPVRTRLLHAEADFQSDIEEIAAEATAFDLENRTLIATTISTGLLLQITTNSICLTASMVENFEDTTKAVCIGNSQLIAAACDPSTNAVAVLERREGFTEPFDLVVLGHDVDGQDDWSDQINTFQDLPRSPLRSEPVSVATHCGNGSMVIVVATLDATLEVFSVDSEGVTKPVASHKMTSTGDAPAVADSICIVPGNNSDRLGHTLLVVCGLRDGRLYSTSLSTKGRLDFVDSHALDFCSSTVKLDQLRGDVSTVYAMGGTDVCRITWEGPSASDMTVESVWITDKERPELLQGPVVSCARLPPADILAVSELASLTAMLSGDEILVVKLDESPSTVPRQISVSGTPNRLLYAEQQRCIVCASLTTDVRSFPSQRSQAPPEERRQIWPTIDFIPSRSAASSHTFSFQPGERVFSLLDWTITNSDNKVYSFIMVGSTRVSKSGTIRGKITFLQASFQNWDIVSVKEGRELRLDSPVYALALYDKLTFVACSGSLVHLFRIDTETMKWEQPCEPYPIASPGVQVTVEKNLIYISTLADSLVVLRCSKKGACVDGQGDGDGLRLKLAPACMAPRAANAISHLSVDFPGVSTTTSPKKLALLSTKHAEMVALASPALETSETDRVHSTGAAITALARLPASLTRLRQGNIRPPWKSQPPTGIVRDAVLGSTTDGRLLGISILDEALWRKLFWLQRLIERSEELSPHNFQSPEYRAEGTNETRPRSLPIGLSVEGAEIPMHAFSQPEEDMHIDGDILGRVLVEGGGEALRAVLKRIANEEDAVGEWVRARLEQELDAIEGLVGVLGGLLESWL
ncbi:hypothetical protein MBLNU230_g5136t1 [Neophaeotheca triangularis]